MHENATAKLNFLVQTEEDILTIEVKAEENLQAKSLRTFIEKYKLPYAVRTSMSDYRERDWLINIPLYAISSHALPLK